MDKQSHVSKEIGTVHGGKQRCQYLVLLGISLFSVALIQAKPVNVHAAVSGEQAEMVVSRASQDGEGSSLEPVKKVEAAGLADGNIPKNEEQPEQQTLPAGSVEVNRKSVNDGSAGSNQVTQQDSSLSKTSLVESGSAEGGVTSNGIGTHESATDAGNEDSSQPTKRTADSNKFTYRTTQSATVTRSSTTVATPKKAAVGKVYVHYVTDIGGELLKTVMTGHVGDKFTAESLDFTSGDAKDFMLKGASQISGIYSTRAQTVTFVYRVPRVRYATKNGMAINTVTYGDGSLKYVEIYDGDFEIDFAKNAQGQPVATVRSLNSVPAGQPTALSSKGASIHGKYFGLFNVVGYSYIFEKSNDGNAVKILKINTETGQVTVQNKSLKASKFGAATVAQKLGIDQRADFISFWHKLMATNRQSTMSYNWKSGNAVTSKSRMTEATQNEERTKVSESLPQTSGKPADYSVLGYMGLLVLSLIGLFVKRETRL